MAQEFQNQLEQLSTKEAKIKWILDNYTTKEQWEHDDFVGQEGDIDE
jgi:hypothetical protein